MKNIASTRKCGSLILLSLFLYSSQLCAKMLYVYPITQLRPELCCRVGEDVATLTPHRPGRADFPHPVLHERGSLTAAYPWKILTEGRGWRAMSALNRAHGTAPPRCRRDNHLRQTRPT